MQASINLPSSPFISLRSNKPTTFSNTLIHPTKLQLGQRSSTSMDISIKSSASDTSEIDYTSMATSVFPAEACETVGGVACDVEMFPETKLREEQPKPKAAPPASETVDREYLEYNSPKTVFIAEACDDLGGEFCEPTYQSGAN